MLQELPQKLRQSYFRERQADTNFKSRAKPQNIEEEKENDIMAGIEKEDFESHCMQLWKWASGMIAEELNLRQAISVPRWSDHDMPVMSLSSQANTESEATQHTGSYDVFGKKLSEFTPVNDPAD